MWRHRISEVDRAAAVLTLGRIFIFHVLQLTCAVVLVLLIAMLFTAYVRIGLRAELSLESIGLRGRGWFVVAHLDVPVQRGWGRMRDKTELWNGLEL